MSNEPQPTPRATEDVHFRLVGAPVETYPATADGPVDYLEVASERQGVLGYLWASPTEDAAGFVARPDAGDYSANEAVAWVRELRTARSEAIPAARLLAELSRIELPLDPAARHYGGIVPGPPATVSSLQALHSVANS